MNIGKPLFFLGLCILAVAGLALLPGCSSDDPTAPDPEPTATPTPAPPTATPTGAWGFTSGSAVVEVSGLTPDPINEKEVIFCLGNPDNENWVNVRHRGGSRFQLKGGLDPDTPCNEEVHVHDSQCADNGIWNVTWTEDGHITIQSPCGTESIHIHGGKYAFRSIVGESCGGFIDMSSPSAVKVLSLDGSPGYASDCTL